MQILNANQIYINKIIGKTICQPQGMGHGQHTDLKWI